MNRHFSTLFLSLLLTLSLTACGGGDQGGYSFSPEASSDVSWTAEPNGTSAPENELYAPEENQVPDNKGQSGPEGNSSVGKSGQSNALDEDGWYSSKEEVALYIHLYGELPDNYVTKDEAEESGWSGGNVERYTGEGTAIGGSPFGNREGLLPKEQGRTYTECDIYTVGGNSRGAKRIVFSNDWLIYYTDDHYESFELLYGEP